MKSRRPNVDDARLWQATAEEVAEGSLRGPLTKDEVRTKHRDFWLAAKRFSVHQGEKIRPIDDFSACLVNPSFGTEEKVSMSGLGQIVGWAKARFEAVDDKGDFELTDLEGTTWSGKLDKGWSIAE